MAGQLTILGVLNSLDMTRKTIAGPTGASVPGGVAGGFGDVVPTPVECSINSLAPPRAEATATLRIFVSVVTFPHAEGQTGLFEVVDALNAERARFGFGQCGQQHGRQNCNDRDNYEQFDERERSDFVAEFLHILSLLVVSSVNSLRTLGNPLFLSTLSLKIF